MSDFIGLLISMVAFAFILALVDTSEAMHICDKERPISFTTIIGVKMTCTTNQ